MSKTLQTRVQMKHDTETNWNKATNFVPLAGEVIIYDADSSNPTPRVKIGNGIDILSNLSFVHEDVGIYVGTDAPTDTSKLWIDTDDNSSSGGTGSGSGGGSSGGLTQVFHAGTSAPSNTNLLWIDTNKNTAGLKYYNGTSWVYVPVGWST